MNPKKPKKERRRRGLTWDPNVIELLARLKLLEFLPEESIKVRLQEYSPSPALDPSLLKKLDGLLSTYSERRVALTHLRAEFQEAIRVICKTDGVLQLTAIAESMKYVQGRVGLPIWPNLSADVDPNADEKRRDRLQGQSQHQILRQSMGLDDGTYNEVVWRESMLLRFDPSGQSLLDWIPQAVRSRLDSEAVSFRGTDFDDARAHEFLRSIPEWKLYGAVMTTLAVEYLRAQTKNDQEFIDVLRLPVMESPIFGMIADGKLGGEGEFPALRLDCPRESFIRYLTPLANAQTQLQGQILYFLLRLDAWYTDLTDSAIPKDLAELWPQPKSIFGMRPTPEFQLLSSKFADELEMKDIVFKKIWAAYITLQMRELLKYRGPASHSVFWTARILESIRPDVYNLYRKQVDHFHAVMHDVANLEGRDGAWLAASVGLFMTGMSSDPLLHAVFHTEVLNGRERLSYKPGRGGTDDHLMNVTLVHAYSLLMENWPAKRLKPVNKVLSEITAIPDWIRESVSTNYFTTDKAVDVGPTSVFAYLTPLALSIFGQDEKDLRPHKTKTRCMDHTANPKVDLLLGDLLHQFSAAVSGRPNS